MKTKKKWLDLLAAVALCVALAGCGGSSGTAADTNDAGAGYSYNAEMEQSTTGDGWADGESKIELNVDPNRKIVYTAALELESKDFAGAQSALLAALDSAGGYVESSTTYGKAETGDRYVVYSFRVPVEQYNGFLQAAESAGSLVRKSENAEDITSSYVDVQSRLTALNSQRDRLMELAAQATTTEDLITIEAQLSDVQYEIENYTAQQRTMDDQIRYSTVQVELNEVVTYTPTSTSFGERISTAFVDSWKNFVEGCKNFAVWFVYAFPGLLVLAVIVIIILLIIRASNRRSQRRMAAQPIQMTQTTGPNGAPKYVYNAPTPPAQPKPTPKPPEKK